MKDLDNAASETVDDLMRLGGAVGQALLDNPDAVGATLEDAALTTAGTAGVAGGAALSGTGAGAVAGVPAAAISGAAVVGGAGMMAAGMSKIAKDAGDNYRRQEPERGLSEYFENGKIPRASELESYALKQGWTKSQSPNGPPTYTDKNGIKRMIIKKGSPRTPGSEGPHVEMRNAQGQRIDSNGTVTGKRQPGNHTSVEYDW